MERIKSSYDQAARISRKAEDPVLRRHRGDYEATRAALAERRKAIAPILAEQLRRGVASGGSKAGALRGRIEGICGLERLQADDVERLSKRNKTTTQASSDLTYLREEIAYADELAKKLGAEVEALTLELQAPPRVTLREKAEVPKTKDE